MERNVKTALAFPGVSTGMCGTEHLFYEEHAKTMAPFLAAASAVADTPFESLLLAEQLDDMDPRGRQLFAYAFSCGAAESFRALGVTPSATAGYSLGVYAALVAAGALSFEEGLAVADKAYEVTARACAGRQYGMAAVIGLEADELNGILSQQRFAGVRLVNTNNHSSFVLAGEAGDIGDVVEEAKQHSAYRALVLDVDVPYHHPGLLNGVGEEFDAYLDGLAWREPVCSVFSAIDHRPLSDPADLRAFTAHNLTNPVDWQGVVLGLANAGIGLVIECGAGVSLTQNARMTPGASPFANLKNYRRKLRRLSARS